MISRSNAPGLQIVANCESGLRVRSVLSPLYLYQALLNLLRNAAIALEGQGSITLRSRAVMNYTIGDTRHRVIASIDIEDDGPGIPEELQDSIFYPLVTTRAEGTGLGLPAAQELLSRHGGLIEFDSRPGCTVFKVRIPLVQATGVSV